MKEINTPMRKWIDSSWGNEKGSGQQKINNINRSNKKVTCQLRK
jgi:hypothetical protein